MGVKNSECDDGMSKTDVDWDGHPMNYTCYHPTSPLLPTLLPSTLECENLPKDYMPKHFCMEDAISYDNPIPHHGDHRPIWPKFAASR